MTCSQQQARLQEIKCARCRELGGRDAHLVGIRRESRRTVEHVAAVLLRDRGADDGLQTVQGIHEHQFDRDTGDADIHALLEFAVGICIPEHEIADAKALGETEVDGQIDSGVIGVVLRAEEAAFSTGNGSSAIDKSDGRGGDAHLFRILHIDSVFTVVVIPHGRLVPAQGHPAEQWSWSERTAGDADIVLKVIRCDVNGVSAGNEIVEDVAPIRVRVGAAYGTRRARLAASRIEQHPHSGHTFTRIGDAIVVGIIINQITDAHEIRQRPAGEAEVDRHVGIGFVPIIHPVQIPGLTRRLGVIIEIEDDGADTADRWIGHIEAVFIRVIVRAVIAAVTGDRLRAGKK